MKNFKSDNIVTGSDADSSIQQVITQPTLLRRRGRDKKNDEEYFKESEKKIVEKKEKIEKIQNT